MHYFVPSILARSNITTQHAQCIRKIFSLTVFFLVSANIGERTIDNM